MDFKDVDIRYFLKESIPFRFKEQSPLVFSDLIKYLFEVDGFRFFQKKATGEALEVIAAEKAGKRHLILAVHRNNDQVIGQETIQEAAEVMEAMEGEHFWVITNSSFSEESKVLADESGIELWDWEALYEALGTLFYDGNDPVEAIEAQSGITVPAEIEPYLKLKVQWQATEGIGTQWYNLGVTISNPTDRNIYMHLDLPALIDSKRNQIMADKWGKGEFVAGMLYSGASIRTNALFSAAKLGERPSGGRIVLTCHERRDMPVTYHLNARLRGQACYVVTYCYTTNSHEYLVMTGFRDEVLAKTFFGRQFISLYYYCSSRLVKQAADVVWLDRLLRKSGQFFIPPVVRRIQKIKSTNK